MILASVVVGSGLGISTLDISSSDSGNSVAGPDINNGSSAQLGMASPDICSVAEPGAAGPDGSSSSQLDQVGEVALVEAGFGPEPGHCPKKSLRASGNSNLLICSKIFAFNSSCTENACSFGHEIQQCVKEPIRSQPFQHLAYDLGLDVCEDQISAHTASSRCAVQSLFQLV
ncbi:UNVERIFIED_CONTAM: hypothetical protein K2H54_040777 [Gekko kuhli]